MPWEKAEEAFITILSAAEESRDIVLDLDLIGKTEQPFCDEMTGSNNNAVICTLCIIQISGKC